MQKTTAQLLDAIATDVAMRRDAEVVARRAEELVVHLTAAALTAVGNSGHTNVGRLGTTNKPILVEQVRQWAAAGGTQILVRPVVDLDDHQPVDSYEIPDRLRRIVDMRDHTCRAPYCVRPAESCDVDHATPHNKGGRTCPCNLVPLCRRHHRAKTFEFWTYEVIRPGLYHWRSRNGRSFLVGDFGTHQLAPPASRHPDQDQPAWADPGFLEF